ncbi:MAG TPA: S46 family peptidase [Terriglobales bacterium]|nr:S46 family peptidase [Terriglobales bacterium]
MRRGILIATLILAIAGMAVAEEGMWLFNHPPTAKIKAKYGFELTQPWLDHTRLSSVRFNNGGSGSFVSPEGLTFTNHHVAQTCLYGLSKEGQDLYKTGFYAKTRAEEPRCPDLELNQLVGIEDVTEKVNAGIKNDTPAAEAGTIQRKNMSQIENDCTKSTGNRCDVVTLYAGGQFHLYQYKKYTDVRLVFAPEFGIAFFGGDPDNFEFPRYDLDVTFFRVYENGQPAKLGSNHFKWTTTGVKDGDLVFVSGHPGSTGRLNTMAQMEFLREVAYPWQLKSLARRVALMKNYMAQSAENARRAQELLFGLENSQKAIKGYNSGLLDESLMAKKAAEEKKYIEWVNADPKRKAEFGAPWPDIAKAMQVQKEIYMPLTYLERRNGFRGTLAGIARTLLRVTEEKTKPNTDRLREYRESALPSLEQSLFAGDPIYKDFEELQLADSMKEMAEQMPNNALLEKILNGRTPDQAAKEMISATKLNDVAVRKELYNGGVKAVQASTDPLIRAMILIDPEARKVRRQYEDEVESVERTGGARLAKIRFAQEGYSTAPDATFTLRLSYGAVKGFVEDGRGSIAKKGEKVPYFTTIDGAFKHADAHGNKAPWELPPSWIKAKGKLNGQTPLNFVSTPDIIGGNSGSPVVNKAGEVVGIIFDGNIQSLPWRFQYEDVVGRAVSVDARGIIEALRNIYGAGALADELTRGAKAASGPKTVTHKKNGRKAIEQKATVKAEPKQ